MGHTYKIKENPKNIIAASYEAMEDAAILGIKLKGVVSLGANEISSYLRKDLEGAEVVGTKFEPSKEKMMSLNPDVILGTDKWEKSQINEYDKIAPTIPYTFEGMKWKENLRLMGQLSGKETEANTIISDYEKDLAEVKKQMTPEMKKKKVLLVRLRQSLQAYGPELYFNPSLYEDLGYTVPEQLKDQKTAIDMTNELLKEMNPDIIFLEYSKEEVKTAEEDKKKLFNNPVFQSTNAYKNDKVFVNLISPEAQGGTAWSKIKFLEAFKDKVIEGNE